jgi:hypothetical protein
MQNLEVDHHPGHLEKVLLMEKVLLKVRVLLMAKAPLMAKALLKVGHKMVMLLLKKVRLRLKKVR